MQVRVQSLNGKRIYYGQILASLLRDRFALASLPEANSGRLRPIGRSQTLLIHAARVSEPAESLGQKRDARGRGLRIDRVARNFGRETLPEL